MHRRTALLALVAALVASACTAGTEAAPPAGGWQVVTPPGVLASDLFARAGGVLVGGVSAGPGPRPLLAIERDGAWQDIPATPATAYGGQAAILHASIDDAGRVVAIGAVTGGAHLNPRWSAWTGTGAGILEEPQTVETFGGPAAGGVTGVVGGDDPLVVGTWSLAPGVTGIAVWKHAGALWIRQPSPEVFTGSASEQVTATAAAGSGGAVVVVGLSTSFRHGLVRQRAIAWVSDEARASWTRVDLDASDDDSAATDVSCAADGCLVVGRLGGRLAAWRLAGTAAARVPLPDRTVDRYAGQPRVADDGSRAVVAVGAGDELFARSSADRWESIAAPAGEVRRLGLSGDGLYVLLRPPSGDQLVYRRDL